MDQQYDSGTLAGLAALTAKLIPASLGAIIMVAIDPPKTRRELFYRITVAGICSIYLGDTVLDALHNWFPFIDPNKHTHHATVSLLVGAVGWFLFSALGVLLKRVQADPVGTIAEVKKDVL